MRIQYSYQYQDFPGAPDLTIKSQLVGYLASLPSYLIFGFILFFVVFGVLESNGMDDDTAGMVALVSAVVALPIIFRMIRTNVNKKLQQQYVEKLNTLRTTNPVEYMKIMQELQRRQNAK